METLEEFFKNRALFTSNLNQPLPTFFSENIYNPEDYSLDFLKEKTKSMCYYLYSALGMLFFLMLKSIYKKLEMVNLKK